MPRTIEKIQLSPYYFFFRNVRKQKFLNIKNIDLKISYLDFGKSFVFENSISKISKTLADLISSINVKCYFLCLVLPDMLALQTAYELTFFPDLRLTLATHLSNFLEFRPFFSLSAYMSVYNIFN